MSRSKRARDNQRKRVYDSEKAIDDRPWDKSKWCYKSTCGGRLETVGEIEDFLDKIVRSRWMHTIARKNGNFYVHAVIIRDGRGTRSGFAYRYSMSGTAVLNLPRWSRSKLVILHEFAHTLTPDNRAAHGPEFCANFLDLVRRWIDKDTHAALKDSFRDHRVKFRRTSA